MIKKVFLVAEIAQAHEGSVGLAHSYIDALAEAGIDAVKFQTHIADAESSSYEEFRIPFSYEDATRFDYWKRMEFTPEQWRGLADHCAQKNIEFISSPFSCAAVDLLEWIGVRRYKIGSGELQNFLMLEKIAQTGKPIILSSGMSSHEEIGEVLNFLKPYGNEISILHCTTAYPTLPGQWGLNQIKVLRDTFGLATGFSDHSGKVHVGIAAAAMGAEILEFHATFDRRSFGPDSRASLTIDEVGSLVSGVRELDEDQNTSYSKESINHLDSLKAMFGKSLAVNKDLCKGHVLKIGDLESKKPSNRGIPAKEYKSVIGKVLRKDLKQWSFLTDSDIDQ